MEPGVLLLIIQADEYADIKKEPSGQGLLLRSIVISLLMA